MTMQLSVTPFSSDHLLWIGLGLIVLSLAYLRLLVVVDKTRRAFHALQPDVQISKIVTVYADRQDRLTFCLRNTGGSPASQIRATIREGVGIEPSPAIAVMNPGCEEQEAWIQVKSDSPLLQKKQNNIQLIVRYWDQWGNEYKLMFPVAQLESVHGHLALHLVERGKPRVFKPAISVWRMRLILQRQSGKRHKDDASKDGLGGYIDVGHEELLSQSLIHSYLCRVWNTQNKRCIPPTKSRYRSRAMKLPST